MKKNQNIFAKPMISYPRLRTPLSRYAVRLVVLRDQVRHLVLMVVSVSATIHLLNAFLATCANHMPHRAATAHAIRDITPACGLTTLTTMLGFFSLLVSPVPAVRDFALLAGLA